MGYGQITTGVKLMENQFPKMSVTVSMMISETAYWVVVRVERGVRLIAKALRG